MDHLTPLIPSHKANTLEYAMNDIFMAEFGDLFNSQIEQVYGYAAPFLSTPLVVERFMKQDGLFVVKRPDVSDKLMRIIYANWRSMASKRGLAFLQFVLSMLWPQNWQIQPLYHPIAKAAQYPTYLTTQNHPEHFLTSRIRVLIDSAINLQELSEIAPTLQRLVPANIVPTVASGFDVTDFGIQVGLGCYPMMYADFF